MSRAVLMVIAILAACRDAPRPPPAPADDRPPAPVPMATAPRLQDADALARELPDHTMQTRAAGDPMQGLAAISGIRPLALRGAVRMGRHHVGLFHGDRSPFVCHPRAPEGLGRHVVPSTFAPADTLVDGELVHTDAPDDGEVPLREGLPPDAWAATRHTHTRATAWIDRRRRWVDVTADLTFTGAGAAMLLDRGGSFDVVEVSQDGRPLPWIQLDSWLRVEPRRTGAATIRVRARGRISGYDDWIAADGVRLQRWLPVWPGARPAYDVTIHVPEGDRVDAELGAARAASVPGWRAWRITGEAAHAAAAIQADGGAVETFTRGGVAWTVRGDPALRAQVERAADAMAPLGAPAAAAVSLVAFPMTDEWFFPRADAADVALVPAFVGAPVGARHALAASVAARWLAGAADRTLEPCAWRDAAASAFGLWALDEADARAVRADWSELAGLENPYRLAYPGPSSALRRELCARGALVWAELERRIGRAEVIALVAALRASAAGRGWVDVADALAARPGRAGDAAWLRHWIERPLPPAIGLIEVARRPDAVTASLVQDPLPEFGACMGLDEYATAPAGSFGVAPYAGPVTVAAMAGTREVARVEVELGLARAPVRFAPDPAITHLAIDPDDRLPLRPGPALAVAVPPVTP